MEKYIIDGLELDVDTSLKWRKTSCKCFGDMLGWRTPNDSFIERLIEMYWTSHPRFQFLKFSKPNCIFLDLGAGNGGLTFWKNYMNPLRHDIQLYGIDLYDAEYSDNYVSFDVLDIDNNPLPYRDAFFDAIYLSHLLEHLKNPLFVIEQIDRKLRGGGKLYIELPAKHTYNLPSCVKFREAGIDTDTINFYDDSTHLQTYEVSEIEDMFSKKGYYKTNSSGAIYNEYLEDKLISAGIAQNNKCATMQGLWSKLRFSNYVILEKEIR